MSYYGDIVAASDKATCYFISKHHFEQSVPSYDQERIRVNCVKHGALMVPKDFESRIEAVVSKYVDV